MGKGQNLTCAMILSDKSSGSSVLQRELSKHPDVKHIQKTRHFAGETLYWNKAAALLGMKQVEMEYSELPMRQEQAKRDLLKFLRDNISSFEPLLSDEELVFQGWLSLCEQYKPLFIEKSPHHLHYWSALELIDRCRKKYPQITFKFIGLIRNPMDVLYSMWKRWGAIPERAQYEWLRACANLLRFKDVAGDDLYIARYEDLVTDVKCIQSICSFIGIEWSAEIGSTLHQSSLKKWKKDHIYGFQLAPEVMTFALRFYKKEELQNEAALCWPFARKVTENRYRIVCFKRHIKRMLQAGRNSH